MKKFIILASMIFVLFVPSLVACGSGSNDNSSSSTINSSSATKEEKTYLKLTTPMLNEIKDKAKGNLPEVSTVVVVALRATFKDMGYDFTNFKITSQEQTDSYTYTIHGDIQVHYEGTTWSEPWHISYKAQKDTDDNKGYKIVTGELLPDYDY